MGKYGAMAGITQGEPMTMPSFECTWAGSGRKGYYIETSWRITLLVGPTNFTGPRPKTQCLWAIRWTNAVNLLSSLWINHQPTTPSMYAAPVLTVINNT
jgi:hypothetical protein